MVLHVIRADILLIARIFQRNSQNIRAYYMYNYVAASKSNVANISIYY